MTAVGDVLPPGTTTPDDVTGIRFPHHLPGEFLRGLGGNWVNKGGGTVGWQLAAARERTVTRLVGQYDPGQQLTGADPEPCVGTVVATLGPTSTGVGPTGTPIGVWLHVEAGPGGWAEVGTRHEWDWPEIHDTGDVVVLYAPHHRAAS